MPLNNQKNSNELASKAPQKRLKFKKAKSCFTEQAPSSNLESIQTDNKSSNLEVTKPLNPIEIEPKTTNNAVKAQKKSSMIQKDNS